MVCVYQKRFIQTFLIVIFVLSVFIAPLGISRQNEIDLDCSNAKNTDSHSSRIWSITEVISTESTLNSYSPSVSVDSLGNVHVVWHDYTDYQNCGSDTDIFYKCWFSSNHSWSKTYVVSTESTSNSYSPSISIDSSDNVHIFWQDTTNYQNCGSDADIFYKCWFSSNHSWSKTYVVSTESVNSSCCPSSSIDSSGNIYVVWEDYTDYQNCGSDTDIFCKIWNATTKEWSSSYVVSTESTSSSEFPAVGLDPFGNIHVVWEDYTDYQNCGSDTDIFYKIWNATTQSWGITQVVSTESTVNSHHPDITVDPIGNIHIVWEDGTSYQNSGIDTDIFYKSWIASSNNWTLTQVISTESTSYSYYPQICSDYLGNIHVVWEDETEYENGGSDTDIFYKWLPLDSNWTNTEIVSTESLDFSGNAAISVGLDGTIHIVWTDFTRYASSGRDFDIFYKKCYYLLEPPELAFIVPNPNHTGNISLCWNEVQYASEYYVFRSTSYIWNVDQLSPIACVKETSYNDTLFENGFYYYVIVASSYYNNCTSNCQYVEVLLPEPFLSAPTLAFIIPNPTSNPIVSLTWNEIEGASHYYLYRSTNFIWSVEGLKPIATVSVNTFNDTLPSEGYYYYVVVAANNLVNSSISNCQYVYYSLNHLDEFTTNSMILAMFWIVPLLFIAFLYKKKLH